MKKGLIILLIVGIIATSVWGYNEYEKNMAYSIYLENQFQRMFYDTMVDVENIQVNLSKTLVTGTPRQNVMLFTDIMHLSYDAQEKLSQLPIDQSNVSKTEKFLSQVGDLSMALARKNLEGKPLNEEEMGTLEELHNYSNFLSQQLISLQNDMTDNGVKIDELRRKANKKLNKTNENMMTTSFLNVEEKMQQYPELIYDGPFSEHIKRGKHHLTGGKITKDEVQEIGEEFLGNHVKYEGHIMGEINDHRIPVYLLELKPIEGNEKEPITMAITKTGGKVMWMLDTNPIKEMRLSEKQGINVAKDFLKRKGYENMTPTYSVKYDGQMVINFAYLQEDVVVYPDLMKVKVSLDKGDIVGFEAEGYLMNHRKRDFSSPQISVEEAREKISMNAKVSEFRLAIIPTEGGIEVLCYEFKAQYKQDTFLIYVNAETGEEQKILQVLIKDEGVLVL